MKGEVRGGSCDRRRNSWVHHQPGLSPEIVAYAIGTSTVTDREVLVVSDSVRRIAPTPGGKSCSFPENGGMSRTSDQRRLKSSLDRSQPNHKNKLAVAARAISKRCAGCGVAGKAWRSSESSLRTCRSRRARLGFETSPNRVLKPIAKVRMGAEVVGFGSDELHSAKEVWWCQLKALRSPRTVAWLT